MRRMAVLFLCLTAMAGCSPDQGDMGKFDQCSAAIPPDVCITADSYSLRKIFYPHTSRAELTLGETGVDYFIFLGANVDTMFGDLCSIRSFEHQDSMYDLTDNNIWDEHGCMGVFIFKRRGAEDDAVHILH